MCTINVTAYSTFPRSMRIQSVQADQICIHWDDETEVANRRERGVEWRDDYEECHVTHLLREHDSIDANIHSESTSQILYTDSEKPQIIANSDSHIDRLLIFVPKICDDSCTIARKQHLNAVAVDIHERFNLVRQKLQRFRAMHEQYQRILFHVETNHIKRYAFNGSLEIHWPKLVRGPIEFPIAQVGHVLHKRIEITNPIDEPIEIFYQLHDILGSTIDIDKVPTEIIDMCRNCTLTREPVFSLETPTHSSNRPLRMPPKSTTHLNIQFASDVAGSYASLLYIHNNFTVLEPVWLTAKSVVPLFKFGNRRPGSKTPLLFELTDKHLRDCAHPNEHMRPVMSKRTFTAKNNGEVPIYLRALRIDSLPCEGYGYRITDCAPFELPPNGSKKIEISFTPDFTLSMVSKTLHLETSLNYSVNYTLLSMISPMSLGVCSKAQTRPDWEITMKNVTAVVLAISFICVVCAAYLDSMKVLKVHWENASRGKDSGQTLDLRQIALNSLNSDDSRSTQASKCNDTNSKQHNNSSHAYNSKTNGALNNRKKSNDKDKQRRMNASASMANDAATTKKSWASEIAKKFTTKKCADSKTKGDTVTNSSISALSSAISSTFAAKAKNSTTSTVAQASTTSTPITQYKKNQPKHRDDTQATTVNAEEEEETSSTTTDSSYNSDDKSSNIKSKAKKSNQSKDLSNASTKYSEHSTSAGRTLLAAFFSFHLFTRFFFFALQFLTPKQTKRAW